MGKFATTWGLMKDAWGMLMRDKALMLFPVVSSIACMLVLVTFIAYALQIPSGSFALREALFVNRVLDVVELLLIAALLHVRMVAADTSDAQVRLIAHQNEKLEAAKVSRRLVEVQETERRVLANDLHDLVGQKLAAPGSVSASIRINCPAECVSA